MLEIELVWRDTDAMAFARRLAVPTAMALLASWGLTLGCDSQEPTAPEPAGDAGVGGEAAGGSDAGPTPGACEPGQLALPDGGCQPAGIPADGCGEGFVASIDGGCEAILPATPCGPGQLAIPGETTCHDVAPCGTGPWGTVPTDGSTEHVDAAYPGPTSDGSAAQPWTSIQQAVDAAAPGAIVAIATGTYVETVWVEGKAVRLWGKCPAEVELRLDGLGVIGVTLGRESDVDDSLLGFIAHGVPFGFGSCVLSLNPLDTALHVVTV